VQVRNPSSVTMCKLNRYTNKTTQRLCGYTTAGQDGTSIASAWFTVDDGAPIPVVPTGTSGLVDTSVSLTEGTHLIRLFARSTTGRITQRAQLVTVDTIPPHLVVLSPTTSQTLSKTEVDITSFVSDANTTVVTQWYRKATVPTGTGTVTHTIDLVNRGLSTVLVRATDAAGNTAEVRLQVLVR
jgi:hypothetical protein